MATNQKDERAPDKTSATSKVSSQQTNLKTVNSNGSKSSGNNKSDDKKTDSTNKPKK